jgi:hypothetical protein
MLQTLVPSFPVFPDMTMTALLQGSQVLPVCPEYDDEYETLVE